MTPQQVKWLQNIHTSKLMPLLLLAETFFLQFRSFSNSEMMVDVDIWNLFDDLNQFNQRHVSHRQLIQTEECGAVSEKAQQFLGCRVETLLSASCWAHCADPVAAVLHVHSSQPETGLDSIAELLMLSTSSQPFLKLGLYSLVWSRVRFWSRSCSWWVKSYIYCVSYVR